MSVALTVSMPSSAAAPLRDGRFVPASSPRWRTGGRTACLGEARLLAWSGSELAARFSGESIELRFEACFGQSHLRIEIDERPFAVALHGTQRLSWRPPERLTRGPHRLRIVKCSEAQAGEVRVLGLQLPFGGRLLLPPPPRPLRLVCYGDSISAGACNLDAGEDQYDDLRTHDGTLAYPALVATRLDADYHGIASSGVGLCASWHELRMPEIWDRVAHRPDAARAEPDAPLPEIVLINLGQNDHGEPASRGKRLAAAFAASYLDFVRQVRSRHPTARLVLLLGGMPAWREEPRLWPAVQMAAAALRADGDSQVWTYRFEAWSVAHPRLSVHRQMADELLHFLNRNVL